MDNLSPPCTDISSDPIVADEPKELRAVLEGNAEFARKLYNILSGSPGNVFFSPLSIHAILSLMYQGATGRTKETLSKALNVSDEKIAALGYKDVITRLTKEENVIFHLANKVFVQETYELQESFKSVAEDQFLSEVDVLNFGDASAAAKSINTWVEEQTNNQIRDCFNPDDVTGSSLVLVNVIYFDCRWWRPFNASFTIPVEFFVNDKDSIDVPMMFMDDEKYNIKNDEELGAQVLELPYINDKFCMILILPNERNGIDEVEKRLAKTDLTKITEKMSFNDVRLGLPKFRIEQTIDLQDALTPLGLGMIFTPRAEFSGLIKNSQPLCVGKAIQMTFVEVNEEGTKAGACASFPYPCCLSYPQLFIADHPFVVIIAAKHGNSKSFLFQGRVSEPMITLQTPYSRQLDNGVRAAKRSRSSLWSCFK